MEVANMRPAASHCLCARHGSSPGRPVWMSGFREVEVNATRRTVSYG